MRSHGMSCTSMETASHSQRKCSPPPLPKRNLCHRSKLFPQLLAAYRNIHRRGARSLLRSLLLSHLSFVRGSTCPSSRRRLKSIIPDGLLALVPPLLILRKYTVMSILAADIVGAIALSSMMANKVISMDDGIMNAMVAVLDGGIERKKVIMAVCNALLDLSTGPVGRKRLREFPILLKLLSIFCQGRSPTSQHVSSSSNKHGDDYHNLVTGDGFMDVVLAAVLALINTYPEALPSNVPDNLAKCFLSMLKDVWFKMRSGNQLSPCARGNGCISSMNSNVAESIFRLSCNESQYSSFATESVYKNIFGNTESDLGHFLMNYWEKSPFLFKCSSRNLKNDVSFGSLFYSSGARTGAAVLNNIMKGIISCPPIISDDLDITSFLNEVRSKLGSPPVYGQDIRAVKTLRVTYQESKECQEQELHFFTMETFEKEFHQNDLAKCKEAFQDGYTIALRGMGFRFKKVGAVTCGLADMFGLPSVGANIYLTPPESQGLSLHFDDHCVFVCQLLGQKQWNLFPCQKPILPRLYETCAGDLSVLNGNRETVEEKHLTLQEGDILYIPRGCPHQAHTTVNSDGYQEIEGPSLHLTLAIEVEPPFEWEGFVHISLHVWNEKHKKKSSLDDVKIPYAVSVNLLHIAIRILANQESMFRKACMVFANLPPSLMEQHILHQKFSFIDFISKVNERCKFLDALKSLEVAVDGCNHEALQWLRWLRHLPQEGCENEITDFGNPLESFHDIIAFVNGNMYEARMAFEIVKTKFCSEVVFEDACKSFEILLQKYRGTRRQYMNGMLSLHPF